MTHHDRIRPRAAQARLRRAGSGLVVLVLIGSAVLPYAWSSTAAAESASSGTDVRFLGRVPGGSAFLDPVLGRVMVFPDSSAPGSGSRALPPESGTRGRDGAAEGAGSVAVRGWDPRLAGFRRTPFYPTVRPTHGTGTITTVLGGLCDGLPGPAVAVDPSGVRVDAAGRVFWVDHGWNAHLNSLPYVRVLDTDGTVRTLGNIGGPIEGRAWRDYGTSSGLTRIVPDGRGGVFYTYLGYFSAIGWQMWDTWSEDDLPVTTVIGHLAADGSDDWFSGTRPGIGQYQGYGEVSSRFPRGDGGPIDAASYLFIDAMSGDADGNLYVTDGPVPGFGTSSSGRSDGGTSGGQGSPGGNEDLPPDDTEAPGAHLLRFLNRTDHDATFFAGTAAAVTVSPGHVDTIAGTLKGDGTAPQVGQPVLANAVALHALTAVAVGRDGNVRMLEVSRGGTAVEVRVLGLNVGSEAVTMNGVSVPAGSVAVLAGGLPGYGGDGGKGTQASFDVHDAHWWYGDLAVAHDDSVLVADTDNHRIRRIDTQGRVSTVVGTGTGAFAGDGKPAAESAIRYPMGIDVRPSGEVVIADWGNARIRTVGADGLVRTIAGNGSPVSCGDGSPAAGPPGARDGQAKPYGPARNAAFTVGANVGGPHDVVVDHAGNTYVADVDLNVIRRIAPDGTVRTVVGVPRPCGSGPPSSAGYPQCPFQTPSGDGGPPEAAHLQAPGFLLLDPYENLYISDGSSVRYVNWRKESLKVNGVTVAPGTVATLYHITPIIKHIEIINPFTGELLGAYDQLIGLGGLALDENDGKLWVADISTNRIVSLDWCGVLDTSVVGNTLPSEAGKNNGDGGSAAAARIAPRGLVWDPKRDLLFIADQSGSVRVVNVGSAETTVWGRPLPPGFITTYAGGHSDGTGTNSYGDGGPALDAAFEEPYGLGVDPGGRVFVTDAAAEVVRVIEADGTMGTVAGMTPEQHDGIDGAGIWRLGGECGDGGAATRACLERPVSAQLAPNGDLLVSDFQSGRVRRIQDGLHAPVRVPDPPPPGSGWAFTSPLRLGDQLGLAAKEPSISVGPDGRAFVVASMSDVNGPEGCGLWRYTIDGAGRDRAEFLGLPDGVASLPLLGAAGTGGACGVSVGPPADSAIPGTSGAGARVLYASAPRLAPDAVSAPELLPRVVSGVSTDGGDTFVTSPLGMGDLFPADTMITAREGGGAFMVYRSTGELGFARSTDGVRYSPQSVLVPNLSSEPPAYTVTAEPVVVGSDVFVSFWTSVCVQVNDALCDSAARDSRLYVARSQDAGASWTYSPAIFSYVCTRKDVDGHIAWPVDAWCQGYHGVPQLAADRTGNLYTTWDDGRHVFLSSSVDHGATWSEPVQVDAGLTVAAYPTLVGGDDGRVAIAYYGTNLPARDVASPWVVWWPFLSQTLDAHAAAPSFAQTVASAYAVHHGPLCQLCWEYPLFGGYFRMALNPRDGKVLIAFTEDAGIPGRGLQMGVSVTRQCDGPSLLTHPDAVLPCASRTAGSDGLGKIPVACPSQGTDPARDATWQGSNRDQLDLTSMGVVRSRDDLVLDLGLARAGTDPPPTATGMAWTAFWHFGDLDYWARADTPEATAVGNSPALVAYTWGVVTASGQLAPIGSATGAFTADHVVLTIPAARAGDPKPGSVLADLHARTEVYTGGTPDTSAAGGRPRVDQVDTLEATRGYDPGLTCDVPPGSTGLGLGLVDSSRTHATGSAAVDPGNHHSAVAPTDSGAGSGIDPGARVAPVRLDGALPPDPAPGTAVDAPRRTAPPRRSVTAARTGSGIAAGLPCQEPNYPDPPGPPQPPKPPPKGAGPPPPPSGPARVPVGDAPLPVPAPNPVPAPAANPAASQAHGTQVNPQAALAHERQERAQTALVQAFDATGQQEPAMVWTSRHRSAPPGLTALAAGVALAMAAGCLAFARRQVQTARSERPRR